MNVYFIQGAAQNLLSESASLPYFKIVCTYLDIVMCIEWCMYIVNVIFVYELCEFHCKPWKAKENLDVYIM